MTISKTDTEKLEKRLSEIAAAIGVVTSELYSPMVSTTPANPPNSRWSDRQIVKLTPGVLQRSHAEATKAQNLVIALMNDLRAAERV